MNLRIPGSSRPLLRSTIVTIFTVAAASLYLWLHLQMGGDIPGLTGGYEIEAAFADADNLVEDGDIRMAGIEVGSVQALRHEAEGAVATLRLDDAYAPLHEGATVQLRPKSLVGETFVEIIDGDGAEIDEGTQLPPSAALPSISLDDVLASLDAPTRAALGGALVSLGDATDDTSEEVDRLLAGLGDLGGDGATTLDLLAAQSDDLRSLVTHAAEMMAVLDQGEGQIADLADHASQLLAATSSRADQLEAVTRRLPGFLDQTRTGLGRVEELATALAPVAEDLRVAAPDLNTALVELEPTVDDLRGALPDLDRVLTSAPPTLERLPTLADDVDALTPDLATLLGDLNPMLEYLSPYSRDMGAFFTGFLGVIDYDAQGAYGRILPLLNESSFRGYPVPAEQLTGLDRANPYPGPGRLGEPGEPFSGSYPRVEEEPVEDG